MSQRQRSEEPTKAQLTAWVAILEERLASDNRLKLAENLSAVTKTAIRWIIIAVLGFWARGAIIALAGETTDANLFFRIVTDINFPVVGLAATNVVTFVLYRKERKLRQDNTEHMHRPRKQKELEIDPNRSSSELTERGLTNPQDRE